jgi:hypothetical protein
VCICGIVGDTRSRLGVHFTARREQMARLGVPLQPVVHVHVRGLGGGGARVLVVLQHNVPLHLVVPLLGGLPAVGLAALLLGQLAVDVVEAVAHVEVAVGGVHQRDLRVRARHREDGRLQVVGAAAGRHERVALRVTVKAHCGRGGGDGKMERRTIPLCQLVLIRLLLSD